MFSQICGSTFIYNYLECFQCEKRYKSPRNKLFLTRGQCVAWLSVYLPGDAGTELYCLAIDVNMCERSAPQPPNIQ